MPVIDSILLWGGALLCALLVLAVVFGLCAVFV